MELKVWFRRRRSELARVVFAFVVLALSVPTLVTAGSISWEQGLFYTISTSLNQVLPGNLDVPVVIVAAIVGGWLLLFFLDSTKRVQTSLLLPVVAIVGFLLQDLGHVLDAISKIPLWFTGTLLVTVVLTGFIDPQMRGNRRPGQMSVFDIVRWIQFPIASRALFLTLSSIIIIQTVEYPSLRHPPEAPSTILVFLSGLGCIAGLTVFVKYESQKEVRTITPSGAEGRTALGYGLGGLYRYARSHYDASVIGGDQEQEFEQVAENPAVLELDFDGTVTFKYLPPDLLNRSVVVQSQGTTFDEVSLDEMAVLRRGRTFEQVIRHLHRLLYRYGPSWARRLPGLDYGEPMQLLSGETVLIFLPLPTEEAPPEYDMDTVAHLLEHLHSGGNTDVKLVVTGARAVVNEQEAIDFDKRSELNTYLYDIATNYLQPAVSEEIAEDFEFSAYAHKIYPVDAGETTAQMTGYDALLRDL